MSLRPKFQRTNSPLRSTGPELPSAGPASSRHTQSGPPSKATTPSNKPSADGATRIAVYTKRSPLQGGRAVEFASKPQKTLLEIRLETSPQLLEQVGDFVRAYSKARFQPRNAEKIALASYELIENAVNYGSVSGDVIFTLTETHRGTEICVSNDSPSGRLGNLRAQLERIRVNPEKAYLDEMGRSVTGTGGRAALGLARICHEGQMDLEFQAEGTHVTMRAICTR